MVAKRIKRRLKAPQPPMGVVVTYRKILQDWFTQWQEKLYAEILADWERNPVHFSGEVPRGDSKYIAKKIGSLKIAIQEAIKPGTQLSRDIRTVAARVSEKGDVEFRRLIPITLRGIPGMAASLDAFRDKNVELIKSLALSELDDLTDILEEAEKGAWRVEGLGKAIQDKFGVTKSKADFLARDQVLKLNGDLVKTRQMAAGITHYIWTTSEDERVRPDHAELDGTTHAWTSPPVVDQRTQRRCHPGEDYQCRCTATPILPELDDS